MKIPTIEEIEQYIREKEYTHCDAMEFFYHYDSKGWTVGKVKMTKWKSSVAGWHCRNKKQAMNKANKSIYIDSRQNIEQKARDLNLQAEPGESWDDFNRRVQRTRH